MKKYRILTLLSFALLLMGAKITSDSLKLGRKVAENLTIEFDIGSANNPKILWNNGTGKLRFSNNGTTFFDLGSGSGGGGGAGVNVMTNPGFEEGVANVSTYKDLAGVTPVDGTGGTPTTTAAVTTTSGEVLRGLQSLKINKPASNTQGEGISIPLTIEENDKSSTLSVSFEYKRILAGLAGDFKVYLYDITGSALITPSNVDIPLGQGTFNAIFLAKATSSYRLIVHTATTSTAASSLSIDNVSVGPTLLTAVPNISDWIAYTPALQGSGSVTSAPLVGFYKIHGDTMFIRALVTFTGTGSGSGAVGVSLPPGYSIDSTKITDPSSGNENFGPIAYFTGTEYVAANATLESGQLFGVRVAPESVSFSGFLPYSGLVNGASLALNIAVPISNSSANVYTQNTVVKYGANSGTWDATDTSSFTYNAGGQVLGGTLTATRLKTVDIGQINAGDYIAVQFSDDGIAWGAAGNVYLQGNATQTLHSAAGTSCAGTSWDKVSATTIRVYFCQYQLANDDGTGLVNWPASGYWRVIHSATPIPVGFNVVGQNKSGLVLGAGQLLGSNTDDVPCSGCVGELIYSDVSSPVTINSATPSNLTSIVLTPGDWEMTITAAYSIGPGSNAQVGFSQSSAAQGGTVGIDFLKRSNFGAEILSFSLAGYRRRVVTGTTETWYAVIVQTSGGNAQVTGRLSATRVR